jgi:CelD/BcsL family acetyltransferase involved in cellulose biosynthesis
MDAAVGIEVARALEDLERLRPAWNELPWEREEAAYEYFTTRLSVRPGVIGPYAAVASAGGRAVGGLAARLELRRLSTSVGYKVVYAPTARLLRVVDGGLVGADDPDVLDALLATVRTALADGTADAVELPPAEVGSPLLQAFTSLGGPFERQPFITPWTRRRLELPATFEEFVASRSSNTRWRIRRDARRLAETHGDDLRVEIVRDPSGLDRLVESADRVARTTYQRALGAGFADTPEQRALAAVGLEHGWVRGYLLLLREAPIAYWLCSTWGDTILIRTAGYDPAFAELRVGLFLLMRVIEDAIADPALRVLDFGPGDAAYKQQFSSESREERNTVVFAPTLRGRRLNATRTLVLAPARGVRRILDETGLTDKVRARWRRGAVRLRA